MAKKTSNSKVKKAGKKPATKASGKVAVKNNARPSAKPATKSAPKAKSSSKPAAKATKVVKPVKTVKKAAPAPVKAVSKPSQVVKSKSVVSIKPIVKNEEVKIKAKVTPDKAKQVITKEIKPAITPPTVPAPKSKKVVAPPTPLPPPPSNLPKLPKGFVLKKQKGKLAPGEKRLFKTNVITHHVISEISLDDEKKNKPEPKGKFQMEYIIHTPVTLLYDFLTTPNGLAEWFADGVDMKNDVYTFDWDGQKQNARIISAKIDTYIRMRWLDKPEGTYFEFRLDQDELTNEVSLTVTDFGESPDDIATSRRLWDSQIHRLVKALGTY
jgi:uncharacterized protein YndB with AHSA1/START domain